MGYNLKKDKIIISKQRRIFFKHKNIASFAYPLMVLFCFVITVSLIAPAFAIETTKASALMSEEMREDYSLSYTKKSPQSSLSDPCLSFLTAHQTHDATNQDQTQSTHQPLAGKKAVPVALGFVLGVRIALGPRESAAIKNGVHSDVQRNVKGGTSYPRALAIAAYRGCKNKQVLNQKMVSR